MDVIITGPTVHFKDRSLFKVNSWFWQFGDGATSSAQNPVHTYSNPGTYTVVLTVTGGAHNATDTATKDIEIVTWGFTPGYSVARALLVSGGGGGGCRYGGGGGGGQVLELSGLVLNGSYAVVVGLGGTGSSTAPNYRGAVGGDTGFLIYSIAGGGGGGGGGDAGAQQNGGSAGNGGGAGGAGSPPGVGPAVGGIGGGGITAAGGNGYYNGGNGAVGGGGGGAAPANGGSGTSDGIFGGNGGAGIASNITGSVVYYGGGGGGASHDSFSGGTPGSGGIGGGGAGAAPGLAGQDATSFGGGGGGGDNPTNLVVGRGGNGYPGVVYVRYPGPVAFTGGSISTVGSDTLHTFTTPGGILSGGKFTVTFTGFGDSGWYWDFGDGQSSTLKNPVHSYSGPGPFNVTFSATAGSPPNRVSITRTIP